MFDRLSIVSIVGLCLSGCATSYENPAKSEPHALAYVRAYYYSHDNINLHQDVSINEISIGQVGSGQDTRVLRLRPKLTKWAFFTGYTGNNTSAGSGAGGVIGGAVGGFAEAIISSLRGGGCLAELTHQPKTQGIYLLEYKYRGKGKCTLICRRVYGDPRSMNPEKSVPCGDDERLPSASAKDPQTNDE